MIGGEFYLPVKRVPDCLADRLRKPFTRTAWFCSGRDALFAIVSALPTGRVWVPDFLCQSIWDPILQTGRSLLTYPIGLDLNPSIGWIQDVRPNDAVLVIHYFGHVAFELLEALHSTGARVISDATHLVVSEMWDRVASQSHVMLASLRKVAPFPDGAICGSCDWPLPYPSLPPRRDYWTLRAAALFSRGGAALSGFQEDENFILFKDAERKLDASPAGPHQMSRCSSYLLDATLFDPMRDAAANNTEFIYSHPVPKLIPLNRQGEIATFFPLRFPNSRSRNQVRDALAEQRIHLPVHWDTRFMDHPHPLSDLILSIPCDARYSTREISSILRAIEGVL